MTDRYQKIRDALAMGPTPGPWTAKSYAAPRADNGDIGITYGKGRLVAVAYSNRCTRGNASLIAACDPDTIRELLDERDALAAEVERQLAGIVAGRDFHSRAGRHLQWLLGDIADGAGLMRTAPRVPGKRMGLLRVVETLNFYGREYDHPGWAALKP